MYFQSFGSMSIIKVKAYWFHVRERGVFGAIFGSLISIGVYFAFDWGGSIIAMTKADATGLLHTIFAPAGPPLDATWSVFYIPAAILLFWVLLDWWLIKDSPEEAGFPHFDTHDASSGQMHIELTVLDLLKKVFTSRLMLLIACVELTGGVFRYSMTQWYSIFAAEVKQPGAEFFSQHWGWFTCVFGIVGGFSGGLISDKLFQSRRGPPTALLCGFVLVMAVLMSAVPVFQSARGGLGGGVHRHGLHRHHVADVRHGGDGFRRAQGDRDEHGHRERLCLFGQRHPILRPRLFIGDQGANWHWLPVFVIPFAIIGTLIAIKIWHDLPAATRKYIAEVEKKG